MNTTQYSTEQTKMEKTETTVAMENEVVELNATIAKLEKEKAQWEQEVKDYPNSLAHWTLFEVSKELETARRVRQDVVMDLLNEQAALGRTMEQQIAWEKEVMARVR